MNIVSLCCAAPIVTAIQTELPLGPKEDNGRGINYKVNICEKCELECEEAEACEMCGEISESLDRNGYCNQCVIGEIV